MEVVKRKSPVEGPPDQIDPLYQEKPIFRDNLEYLEALAFETKLRVAVTYIRERNSPISPAGSETCQNPGPNKMKPNEKTNELFPELFPEEVTLPQMEDFLEKVTKENRKKTEATLHQGIELPFEQLCASFGLDHFERTLLQLLTAKSLGKGLADFFNRFTEEGRSFSHVGMKTEILVNIIRPGFREKFLNQKYFSQAGTLIKEDIIILEGTGRNIPVSNILKVTVFLSDWTLRYILGDQNVYGTSLPFITRDRRPIALERVILPQGIKNEIIRLAENYSQQKDRTSETALSQFYGYGKGLTFLFAGPSGTGKTMLAHALAHRLNKDLLTLNLTAIYGNDDLTFEDAMRFIFREARLSDGIVFFDECDDLFREDSVPSRALLIEIEKSDCITILATNEAKELDPALDRRIIMQVPFHLPDEVQREEIWKTSVPPGVTLGKGVDFNTLAKKYFFSGGLIKNTLIMAIQNSSNHNGAPTVLLTREELEKTAEWQATRMLEEKGIETLYQPQVRLEELPIRAQEQKWFQRTVSLYKKTRKENNPGLAFVLGSSDIQSGILSIEGLAAACQLKVKRFSFDTVVSHRDQAFLIDRRSRRREINLLDYAFNFSSGQETLLLFTDPQGSFGKLLERSQEEEVLNLSNLLNKLRSFRGIFFLISKPIPKGILPIEFHQYLELKPPLEDLQFQRWEAHLNGKDYGQEELLDLIERHPLHLSEIDAVARLELINAHLQGDEAASDLRNLYETIGRLKKKIETPILFGPKSSFKKI